MTPSKKLNVLIASYLEPEWVEQIRREVPQVEVIYRPELLGKPRYSADHTSMPERTPEQEAQWRALLAEADILFDFDFSHREDLPDLTPNLKWIQATSAGIGQFVQRMGYAERRDWIFTTASGVHVRPLAEFAIMAMIMFAKNFTYLQDEQANQHWRRYCGTELAGKTLAIVGLGNIGREVGRLAKAFDMRVVAINVTADQELPYVDAIHPPDDLHAVLKAAHYLVLSVPHTPETEGWIGRSELMALPQGAVVINIARGAVMDYAALTDLLQSGHLGGAALDVFPVEPLPPDDPLWSMPNVIISPHSASTADTENQKITDLFCDNLKRYLAGETLRNMLDTERLY